MKYYFYLGPIYPDHSMMFVYNVIRYSDSVTPSAIKVKSSTIFPKSGGQLTSAAHIPVRWTKASWKIEFTVGTSLLQFIMNRLNEKKICRNPGHRKSKHPSYGQSVLEAKERS